MTLRALSTLAVMVCAGCNAIPAMAAPVQAPLTFPRDEGAHPAWKTEWWYVTGWLQRADGKPLGFQVTFFRNRGPAGPEHASAFAPHQLLLAHAALSDPSLGHLRHGERAARSGFGLADARVGDIAVNIDDWNLQRAPDGGLQTHVSTADFSLDLHFQPDQPPLLQGEHGHSQKGRDARAFSWYYSQPHLHAHGTLQQAGQAAAPVQGEAWLDHEWSDAYVSPGAVGWDWTGLNFADGGALMAFRMRDARGQTLWSAGTWRDGHGQQQTLGNGNLVMTPGRTWQSPLTGAHYPVEWTLRWPGHVVRLQPLLDPQELDGRASTSTVYWEGAVRALDAGSTPVAQGYLELTGYWRPLHF